MRSVAPKPIICGELAEYAYNVCVALMHEAGSRASASVKTVSMASANLFSFAGHLLNDEVKGPTSLESVRKFTSAKRDFLHLINQEEGKMQVRIPAFKHLKGCADLLEKLVKDQLSMKEESMISGTWETLEKLLDSRRER